MQFYARHGHCYYFAGSTLFSILLTSQTTLIQTCCLATSSIDCSCPGAHMSMCVYTMHCHVHSGVDRLSRVTLCANLACVGNARPCHVLAHMYIVLTCTYIIMNVVAMTLVHIVCVCVYMNMYICTLYMHMCV